LLAGRAVIRYMHPFIAAELGHQFSLDHSLEYGLVPLVIESADILDTLKAYIGIYLTEEVKAEGLVRNIGNFARFLEVVSFSHGSVLNISNVARECALSRKLIDGYLSVLKDLLLSYQLPIFTLRAKRQLVAHVKFYYFDTGVYRSLRMTGFLDKVAEINGPGLEGLVLQHLRAWNDYQGQPNKLYYWRTKHGVEVDFVVYGAEGLYAIEIKNSPLVHDKDLNGLKTFCEDYPDAIAILLYRGNTWLKKGIVLCIPVEAFLKRLKLVSLKEVINNTNSE